MTSIRLAAAVLVLVCVRATAQDVLNLEPSAVVALPTEVLQQRIDDARGRLPPSQEAWGDQVRAVYLEGTLQLLEAVAQKRAPNVAATMGLTLLDGLPHVEALLAAVPQDAAPDVKSLWPDRPLPALHDETLVRELARQTAGPLMALQQMVHPQMVWRNAWPHSPAPPTAADVAVLSAKVAELTLPPELDEPLTALDQSLRQAAPLPQLLPYVDDTYRAIGCAVSLIEQLDQATWLEAAIGQAYREELAAALAMYLDMSSRPDAAGRLTMLQLAAWVLDDAQQWRTASPVSARTAGALATNTLRVLVSAAEPAARREAVFDWHQRVRSACGSVEDVQMPTLMALRFALVQAQRDWDRAIENVLEASASLVADPGTIHTPAIVQPLQSLQRCAQAIEAVSRVKDAMDAADGFAPVPATGIKQRMMRLAEAARNAEQRPAALAEMASFVAQFERYATLPLEKSLRAGEAGGAGELLAGREADLLRVIAAARTAWASAWAANQEPSVARDAIEPLYVTLALARRVRSAQTPSGWTLAPDMDAWAGWHADAKAMGMLFAPLEEAAMRMLDEASRSDMAALRQSVQALQEPHIMAMAVLRLAVGLEAYRDALPTGLPGVLAQTVFVPAPDAYMARHRQSVATLNRCVQEWSAADDWKRGAIRHHAQQVIRQMNRDLAQLD